MAQIRSVTQNNLEIFGSFNLTDHTLYNFSTNAVSHFILNIIGYVCRILPPPLLTSATCCLRTGSKSSTSFPAIIWLEKPVGGAAKDDISLCQRLNYGHRSGQDVTPPSPFSLKKCDFKFADCPAHVKMSLQFLPWCHVPRMFWIVLMTFEDVTANFPVIKRTPNHVVVLLWEALAAEAKQKLKTFFFFEYTSQLLPIH